MNRGLRIGSGSRLGGLGAFGIKGGGVSDTTPPTVTITSTETSPSAAATIPLTITFSEVVTGFVVGDITVAGCTLSDFSGSGAVYTVTATPTAYEITVDIAQNVCVDGAGNQNTAATQFTISALAKWYLAGAIPAANCKLAYRAIGAADLAASLVNLANPGTNDAAPGSNPTFNAADGWTFDGLDNNLTTGYVPPNQVTRSLAARVSNVATDAVRYICSSRNNSVFFGLATTTTAMVFQNGTNNYTHSTTITSGVLITAGLDPYWNGSDLGNITAGTYDQGTSAMTIGQISTGGNRYSGKIQALAAYDITLTPTQVAALTTAMAALN